MIHVSPSLRKSLGGCVVSLQMSSKSRSQKQPAPMPKGKPKGMLPHILGQRGRAWRVAADGMVTSPTARAPVVHPSSRSTASAHKQRGIMSKEAHRSITLSSSSAAAHLLSGECICTRSISSSNSTVSMLASTGGSPHVYTLTRMQVALFFLEILRTYHRDLVRCGCLPLRFCVPTMPNEKWQ